MERNRRGLSQNSLDVEKIESDFRRAELLATITVAEGFAVMGLGLMFPGVAMPESVLALMGVAVVGASRNYGNKRSLWKEVEGSDLS